MECKEIVKLMEQLAPVAYKEDWDNVGLLVGRDDKAVKKVMIALDPSEDVINQAVKEEVDMLITHHPLIFSPLKRINCNDYIGRKVYMLASHDIAYYAAHTNMDAAVMADVAATKLEMLNVSPLSVTYKKKMYKLVVYVPEQAANKVRDAITKAGAGFTGNYSHCTFNIDGMGTFKPCEGANPYIGEINELTKVNEVRVESIITDEIKEKVIKAMLKVHPYEEVAYDVYELDNSAYEKGIGKKGYLPNEMTLKECANLVKDRFCINNVMIAGNPLKKIVTVAICPGAGKSLIKNAIAAKTDLLITGDIDHHSALDAVEQGLSIIDATHFGTEHFVVEYIRDYLVKSVYKTDDDIFSNYSKLEVVMAQEQPPFQVI